MALIFRGFVIEGFLIPTGSMAPTLLGKHMRVTDESSGYQWTVGPWDYADGSVPYSVQGVKEAITVNDPMTRAPIALTKEPLLAGDRVFVMKYLEGVHEPERWQVVVFKVPKSPQENFIKRLIGLPSEQLAIVDGDVFYREASDGSAHSVGAPAWTEDDWKIARKSERVQRAMFQTVFDSRFIPPADTQEALTASNRYRSPWSVDGGAGSWSDMAEPGPATYSGTSDTTLTWDSDRYPLDDYTPYNQNGDPDRNARSPAYQGFDRDRRSSIGIFPVSDVAVSLALEPEADGTGAIFDLRARGHRFEAIVENGKATLRMRVDASGAADRWITLDESPLELPSGRTTVLEFWHVDQTLWLLADGELVAGGPEDGAYELTPADRVMHATGQHLAGLLSLNAGLEQSPLADPSVYRAPSLSVTLKGGAVTLHRSVVSRDIFYQTPRHPPARAGHPMSMPTLSPEEYFLCGDNSPNSHDARSWDYVDKWVSTTIHDLDPLELDDNAGLVHRDLLVGRAFVVYLPAPVARKPLPIPMLDFGRMRWIW